MSKRIFLYITFLFLTCSTVISAQTGSDTVRIYFKQDYAVLDENYMGNKIALDLFRERIIKLYNTPGHRTHKISIISGASPEGRSDRNDQLSTQRAQVIRQYLIENTPQLPTEMFVVKSAGEDWDGLLHLVENRYDVPQRAEVMDILRNTPVWVKKDGKIVDGKKRQLQNLGGGYPWRWMLTNLFPKLRQSTAQVDYRIEELPGYNPKPEPKQDPQPEPRMGDTIPSSKYEIKTVINIGAIYINTAPQKDTSTKYLAPVPLPAPTPVLTEQSPKIQKDTGKFRLVIKTNLLYDLAVIPNIGLELGIAGNLAASASYENIWLRDKDWTQWYRVEGFEAGLKYYINRHKKTFKGHHFEIYGQMLTWDITYDGTGYLAERWALGGGIAYGYAIRLARRLNLDLEIGAGYLQGNMHKYIPQDGHRVWQSLEKFQWIGPTRAGFSLQWLIGRGNYNERKNKGRRDNN